VESGAGAERLAVVQITEVRTGVVVPEIVLDAALK
jgi:hypothetical protein